MAFQKKRRLEAEGGSADNEIRALLNTLSRESALDLLAVAAAKHPDIYDDIQNFLNDDPEARKVFVRSLDWGTTDETVKEVFDQFGQVLELGIVRDQQGKSKGFAFITYATLQGAQKAVASGSKLIDGRQVHVHMASERNQRTRQVSDFYPMGIAPGPTAVAPAQYGETKLFVHSLDPETTSETLHAAFEAFGPIQEALVAFDKDTKRSKGYGFVTYLSPESARAALQDTQKVIDGRITRCNYASERKKPRPGFDQTGNPVHYQQPMAYQQPMQAYGRAAAPAAATAPGAAPPIAPNVVTDIQTQLRQLQAAQVQLTQALSGAGLGGAAGAAAQVPGAMQAAQYPPQQAQPGVAGVPQAQPQMYPPQAAYPPAQSYPAQAYPEQYPPQ